MKKGRKNKKNWRRVIGLIVLFSFILSICYVIFRIGTAPNELPSSGEIVRVKSDYVLMLLQCIVGLVAMQIPNIINRKTNLEIPSNMYLAFVIFLYCAIYLGEVRNFYFEVTHWDVILHAFSGAMLGALGFSVINMFNKNLSERINLSPIFVTIFAFCFAITIGVFWEIYEFTFDGILNLNMQKFAAEGGISLVGRAALMDTMKDLIVNCLGASVICIIGYISLRYRKGWFDEVLINFKTSKEQ